MRVDCDPREGKEWDQSLSLSYGLWGRRKEQETFWHQNFCDHPNQF